MPLLDVKNLTVRFHTRNGIVHAVENLSFTLDKGETLGIVGESGSGKSVSCYSILGLIPKPPGRIHKGSANFNGQDLLKLSENKLSKIRGKSISMIFQDPMTSLNPYMKIGQQVAEPLLIHEKTTPKNALAQAITALDEVGIPDPEKRIHSYPHELSGGMRQRVMIAMALITKPEILIADEPTTALDVTVQKQVLDLIKKRQKELGTALILITHDLAVVSHTCDKVGVMYAGRLVEQAPCDKLFATPLHAYTRALIKSIPATHEKKEPLYTIPGLPPNLQEEPKFCSFRPRNNLGNAKICKTDTAPEFTKKKDQHYVQDCPGCLANKG